MQYDTAYGAHAACCASCVVPEELVRILSEHRLDWCYKCQQEPHVTLDVCAATTHIGLHSYAYYVPQLGRWFISKQKI